MVSSLVAATNRNVTIANRKNESLTIEMKNRSE